MIHIIYTISIPVLIIAILVIRDIAKHLGEDHKLYEFLMGLSQILIAILLVISIYYPVFTYTYNQ